MMCINLSILISQKKRLTYSLMLLYQISKSTNAVFLLGSFDSTVPEVCLVQMTQTKIFYILLLVVTSKAFRKAEGDQMKRKSIKY